MNPNSKQGKEAPPDQTGKAENRRFRRENLLLATMKTVARDDIRDTTIEQICVKAGISQELVAQHYESKEALLIAALEDWFQTAFTIKQNIANNKSLSAEQRLRFISSTSFSEPTYSWENAAAWQAFTNASRYDHTYVDSIHSASRKVCDLRSRLFDRAARDRKVQIDEEFSAKALYAFEDGLWNSLATGKDDLTVGDARRACDRFIDGCFVKDPRALASPGPMRKR